MVTPNPCLTSDKVRQLLKRTHTPATSLVLVMGNRYMCSTTWKVLQALTDTNTQHTPGPVTADLQATTPTQKAFKQLPEETKVAHKRYVRSFLTAAGSHSFGNSTTFLTLSSNMSHHTRHYLPEPTVVRGHCHPEVAVTVTPEHTPKHTRKI